MKNKKPHLRAAAMILAAVFLLPLASCGEANNITTETEAATVTDKITETEAETTEEITETTPEAAKFLPEDGEVVSLLNDVMTTWLSNYKRSKLDKIFDYTERCEPVPVHFSFGGEYDYVNLFVSEKSDMSSPLVFLCNGGEADIEELLPGTEYFWYTVGSKDGVKTQSEVHNFKTLYTPRTIYLDGVSNVRDIGGKITYDGKRIKYGIAYRGADFAHITEEGVRKAVDVLGIKTELDLRNKVSGTSPLGKDIKYYSVTAPYYGYIEWSDYKAALLEELRVFTDADNFPVYFHCSLGRDRTGTLAFLLLALLGADETDIYKDYETSFFSDMGGYVDAATPSGMVTQLNSLKSIVSASKKPLYQSVREYLIRLGMTDAELDQIRANMLEDVQ